MTTLRAFLTSAKKALLAPTAERSSPLTFVVGNESADLDSLCSAMVLAFIRSNVHPRTLHIPLSNIPRADLALRTEMTAVLEQAGLQPSDLLTLSELPDLRPEDTRWFLVDHNSLTGQLSKFQKQVIGCIDHHVDENSIPHDVTPRVVEPCGSCMSLVVDECRGVWEEAAADEQDKLAQLALAPILIDTINLSAHEKVKEKDRTSATFLEGKAHQDFDRTKLYEDINVVKEDISSLGFRDIFRKDYKEWMEGSLKLGISCSVQNLQYLVDKADGSPDGFIAEFEKWSRERELDVSSVMTTATPNGEFQRELLVWGMTAKGSEALSEFVLIAGNLQLWGYKGGRLNEGIVRLAWKQENLVASRKQVAPLLREAMKKVMS